jgi:glyoxylase-like metal-dependent hydrolase (beta-lactamase superfamily II)
VDITLHPLSDGFFGLDGGAMFGVAPRVLWQKTNPPDEHNRILLALRPLLIRTPSETIVVDAGIGRKYGDGFNRMFNVDDSDTLETSLARCGVAPGQVTGVVLTHLHFDHAGGVTKLDGDGRPVPTFPDAKHFVQADEWHDATHPNRRTRGSYRDDDFLPLEAAGLLELVDGDVELTPNISLLCTGGHTRGHQIVLVETSEGRAVYWSDLVPTASHVNIPYVMAYDLFPLVTIEQKERLLERAAAECWTCFFEHEPGFAAGTVASDGRRFAVTPVKEAP